MTKQERDSGTRLGWYSLAINLFLLALNSVMAWYSGSLALMAETAHNILDILASIFVLLGLWLSQRKQREFPYGLYKVENIVQALIAISIFFTGYEIAKDALFAPERTVTVEPVMLLGVAIAIAVPLLFSQYEMKVGRMINSPSLIADATEFRAHIFSSGLVFVAVAGQLMGIQLDRIAALLIVGWIVYEGWHTLVDAMRVLLDASVDQETLELVRRLILDHPEVEQIKSLRGRNSGRYRFLEAEICLHVAELEKAHAIANAIEREVKEEVPFVESILIHTEPCKPKTVRLAVPLADDRQTIVSIGNAAYFAFYTIHRENHEVQEEGLKPNPFLGARQGRGIKVAQWLVREGIHAILLPADRIEQKGFLYVLQASGVQIFTTQPFPPKPLSERIGEVALWSDESFLSPD